MNHHKLDLGDVVAVPLDAERWAVGHVAAIWGVEHPFHYIGFIRAVLGTLLAVVLMGACGQDVAGLIGTTYTHSFGEIGIVRVDPGGSLVAVSGDLDPGFDRDYGLEFISLDDGSRRLVPGLPAGVLDAMSWTPDGSTLVVVMEPLSERGVRLVEGCGNPGLLVLVSRDGVVQATRPLSPEMDVSGIAAIDGSVAVVGGLVSGSCDRVHLWSIDLATGGATDLGVEGDLPERAGGGVAFLDVRRLRWLDLGSGETRDLAPGLTVLFLAGSASPMLAFRGYDQVTGDVGLYRVNVAAAGSSPQFLFETALNRISLDDSGTVLVGFLPEAGPDPGRIVAIDLAEYRRP